jgi:hypothetical protein
MVISVTDLIEAVRNVDENAFWAMRGLAIQAYASLEQAECDIFTHLSGTTREVSGIIFFRINNASARLNIIEKLFRIRFGEQYNQFRNSLLKELRPIDAERNEIVHWNSIHKVFQAEDGKARAELYLYPPAVWDFEPTTPTKSKGDMAEFVGKCDFYRTLIQQFCVFAIDPVKDPSFEDARRPWLDIFQQPITYPPPSTHPLFRKPPEPSIPPEPSPG